MSSRLPIAILLGSCVVLLQMASVATTREPTDAPTLEQVRAAGALRSSYRTATPRASTTEQPEPDLKTFREEIEPGS